MPYPSPENHYLATHIQLLNDSYQRLFNQPLITAQEDNLAKTLFYAPFVLLSHNNASEPLFNYANHQGLELFEFDWRELITTPSKKSAEVINQTERAKLLQQVTEQGFISHYQGIRISKTGKRFKILQATVWNLIDPHGDYQGQAACFAHWQFIE